MSWHTKILHVTWAGKSIEWNDHGHPESGTKTMTYLDTGQAGVNMASSLFYPVGLSLMTNSHPKDVFMRFPSVNSAQWTQREVVLRYTRGKFWDMFSCEVIEKNKEGKEKKETFLETCFHLYISSYFPWGLQYTGVRNKNRDLWILQDEYLKS